MPGTAASEALKVGSSKLLGRAQTFFFGAFHPGGAVAAKRIVLLLKGPAAGRAEAGVFSIQGRSCIFPA